MMPTVVLGATGYVGGELLRLIAAHPFFELAAAVSESRAGDRIADVFAHLAPAYGESLFAAHDSWLDQLADGSQLALFSAAPHGASAAMIAGILAAAEGRNIDVRVVDAAGDVGGGAPSPAASLFALASGCLSSTTPPTARQGISQYGL